MVLFNWGFLILFIQLYYYTNHKFFNKRLLKAIFKTVCSNAQDTLVRTALIPHRTSSGKQVISNKPTNIKLSDTLSRSLCDSYSQSCLHDEKTCFLNGLHEKVTILG